MTTEEGLATKDWIPVALGKDVPAGTTRSALAEGRELVIWRGADGRAHVWEDRCPHRGMRLSFGFVRGDTLNCLYHGWQYGGGAQCMHMPAHPDLRVPPSIRANAYGVAEAGGMIWTQFDGAADGPVPDVPAGARPLASIAVNADPAAIHAAAIGAAISARAKIFTLSRAEAVLHVGWHLVHPGKTMLHAVIESGDPGAALGLLRSVRARAEAEVAA